MILIGLTHTTQIYDGVYGSTIEDEIGQQQQKLKGNFNHGKMFYTTQRNTKQSFFIQTYVKSKFIIVSCVCDHRPL